MMLGARTAAWSGKSLPYDAEVEYLESTRMQWIDTAVLNATKVQFSVWHNTSADIKLFGNSYMMGNWADISYYRNQYRESGIEEALETWDIVILEKEPQRHLTVIRGDEKFTASRWFAANNTTNTNNSKYGTAVPLFGHTNEAGIWFGENRITTSDIALSLRISSFKAWENDTLIRDFIPVLDRDMRPAMYDRVTGKLFYNKGTGEFVIGPDKTT